MKNEEYMKQRVEREGSHKMFCSEHDFLLCGMLSEKGEINDK